MHLTQDPFIKEAGDKWHSIDSKDNIEKLSEFVDLLPYTLCNSGLSFSSRLKVVIRTTDTNAVKINLLY